MEKKRNALHCECNARWLRWSYGDRGSDRIEL